MGQHNIEIAYSIQSSPSYSLIVILLTFNQYNTFVLDMGGRGSSYTKPSKPVSELEDLFKSAETEVLDTRIRNLFSSFDERDRERVYLLKEQAKSTPFGFRFDDCSDTVDDKLSCVKRIAGCLVLLCFIGQFTHENEYVSWQIAKAIMLDKKIIGIMLFPERTDKVPSLISEKEYLVTEWDPSKISRLLDDI